MRARSRDRIRVISRRARRERARAPAPSAAAARRAFADADTKAVSATGSCGKIPRLAPAPPVTHGRGRSRCGPFQSLHPTARPNSPHVGPAYRYRTAHGRVESANYISHRPCAKLRDPAFAISCSGSSGRDSHLFPISHAHRDSPFSISPTSRLCSASRALPPRGATLQRHPDAPTQPSKPELRLDTCRAGGRTCFRRGENWRACERPLSIKLRSLSAGDAALALLALAVFLAVGNKYTNTGWRASTSDSAGRRAPFFSRRRSRASCPILPSTAAGRAGLRRLRRRWRRLGYCLRRVPFRSC